MQKQRINEIRNLAHKIDPRINLFEGYSPKETDLYKGELLFWRQVVTLYGLFSDCDRSQLKEKKNLFELMLRYDLIDRTDYDAAIKFWEDVSELRKWFCHNNDISLFYARNRQNKIENYLNTAFLIASNKPKKFEDIQPKDWNILTSDLDRRFQEYLDCLKNGLVAWSTSDDSEDLIDEWICILAKTLFSDKELIQNVLADIAVYEKINHNIYNMTVPQLGNSYFRQLEVCNFSSTDIEDELRRETSIIRTNREILSESIRNTHFL